MNAAIETSESGFAAPAVAPHPVRPFYWSVRRELWENRSLMIAPLVTAGVLLLALVTSLIANASQLPQGMQVLASLPPERQQMMVAGSYAGTGIVIALVMNIAVFFYLLDALQGERKDRSVLFWKSLPVSDTTAVLSKVLTAVLISPAIVLATVIATQIVVLLLATVILLIGGVNPVGIWANPQLFQMVVASVYALLAIELWYAPVTAWLLFVSSWAKRVAILWATLTPVALMLFEHVAFGTRYVRDLIGYRLVGGLKTAFVAHSQAPEFSDGVNVKMPHRVLDALDPIAFFGNPWLWVGLVVAAGFVAAAIWMRRYREPL
jgi:ABC-2 type transport system permease protein